MDLPRLIPVPPLVVRRTIPDNQWEATLEAWILLIELRLRLPADQFGTCAQADQYNVTFFESYFESRPDAPAHGFNAESTSTTAERIKVLRKLVFTLLRRYYLEINPSDLAGELVDWRFIADFSDAYHGSSALRKLLSTLWSRHHDTLSSRINKGKSEVISMLPTETKKRQITSVSVIVHDLRRLSILASALPQVGCLLMTGSDYIDSLHDAYSISISNPNGVDGIALRKALVANVYLGFVSLLKQTSPNLVLLIDQMFSLQVSAGVGATISRSSNLTPELLSDLICSTDILVRIERFLALAPQKRGQELISSLRKYQQQMRPAHEQHYQRRKISKDKGKVKQDAIRDEVSYAHKESLITQIRDLFPNLGTGFVARLLDYYADNVETIVAHLLEDTLPLELNTLDRSEHLPKHDTTLAHKYHSTTGPPKLTYTRNIDLQDDEIVEVARSAMGTELRESVNGQKKKLLFGGANFDSTADSILADRTNHVANKAAILAALATFDSDDDERDDTYDIADVGGTVDKGVSTTDLEGEEEKRSRLGSKAQESRKAEPPIDHDMILYRLWKSNPSQFSRDSATRRSQSRNVLKTETGMTDEAIEGWAIMLQRDAKKQSRLESRLLLGAETDDAGNVSLGQPELSSTAYRRPAAQSDIDTDQELDGDSGPSTGTGSTRGRGRGHGGRGSIATGTLKRGRGGNRGRGANHRRREQHAKKMARAGALPS